MLIFMIQRPIVAIQVLRNSDEGGGCQIFRKKHYVISVMRGWVQFSGKKHYVTLEVEWPHSAVTTS